MDTQLVNGSQGGEKLQPPVRPWDELRASMQGKLLLFTHENSFKQFKLFNSASRDASSKGQTPEAVLFPLCSKDVSAGVRFAASQSLSLSVKSGGYNPSNWSSAGQLVIDLSKLNGIAIDLPDAIDKEAIYVDNAHKERLSSHGSSLDSDGPFNTSRSNSGSSSSSKPKRKAVSPAMPTLEHADSDQSSRSTSDSGESSGSFSGDPRSATSSSTSHSSTLSPQSDKGKRRMLDSDQRQVEQEMHAELPDLAHSDTEHELQKKEIAEISSLARKPDIDGMRCADSGSITTQHHQPGITSQLNKNKTDGPEGSTSTDNPDENEDVANFVLANSYPPMNLASADPSRARELVQELRNKLRTQKLDNRLGNRTRIQPFNYDVTKKEAKISDDPVAGAVPFSDMRSMNEMRQYALELGSTHLHSSSTHSRNELSTTPRTNGNVLLNSPSSAQPSQPRALTQSDGNLSFGVQNPEQFVTITFGPGVRAKDLDKFTYPHGYLVPLACYPVGTAIFTTGGYGFVSRLFGLSMDLTTEMEIVLPSDGRVITLKSDWLDNPTLSLDEKKEQEELWWAVRGAGTAFGIVTKIKAKAFRIGNVLAGNLIYPFNPITTPSLLKHWRDCTKNAPRELYSALTLTAGPSPDRHVIVIQFSWCGKEQASGEALLRSILSWEGERCLLKDVEVRPYSHQQENVSQILTSRDDSRWLVRSTLLHSLTDRIIHETVNQFIKVPSGASWLFEIAGGAIGEPPYPSCYPVEHRMAPFQTAALHQWVDPVDDERQKASAEHWIYNTLDSEGCGPFPCFLASGEGRSRMIKVYGQRNWDRLSALKKKYDSKGLLRYTHFEDELLK